MNRTRLNINIRSKNAVVRQAVQNLCAGKQTIAVTFVEHLDQMHHPTDEDVCSLFIYDVGNQQISLDKLIDQLSKVAEPGNCTILLIANHYPANLKTLSGSWTSSLDIILHPVDKNFFEFKLDQLLNHLQSRQSSRDLHVSIPETLDLLQGMNRSSNLDRLAFQLVNQITENIQLKANGKSLNKQKDSLDHSMLDVLVDALPNPIYIKDESGQYIKVNKAFEDLTGLDGSRMKMKTIYDLVPFEKAKDYEALDQKAFQSDNACFAEENLNLGNGNAKDILVMRSPFMLSPEDGRKKGIIGLILDVSERRRAEKYLQLQRDLEYYAWFQGGLMQSMEYMTGKILEISWVDGGGIYLFDEQEENLKLIHHRGLDQEFIAQVKEYHKNTSHVRLVKKGLPHYALFGDLKASLKSKVSEGGFKISAILPLKHDRRVIGSLNLISKSLTELSNTDKTVIESIAAKMGSVIAYIKAQEELEQTKKMLEAKVSDRTRSLEQTNKKLEKEIQFHKATQEALNFSENLYRSIFKTAQDGILLYRADNRQLVDYNQKILDTLGYSKKEFVKLEPSDFMIYNTSDEREKIYREVLASRQLIRNMRMRTKSGEIKYALINALVTRINDIEYLLIIFHDQTELETATRELNRSEQKIRELQDNVSIGMFRLNSHLKIIYLNPFARRLLKIKKSTPYEKLHFSDFEIPDEKLKAYFRRLVSKGSLRNLKMPIRKQDGSVFYANINLKLARDDASGNKTVDGTIEDITLVRKAQDQLKAANKKIGLINRSLEKRIKEALEKQKRNQAYMVQKSKLESLGELAAGIAHEINQPLGVMSLAFENLQSRFFSGETDAEYLYTKFTSIDENIERIRNIIDQVRTFSRDDTPLMIQKVFINHCVENVLKLIGTQYQNHGVELILDLDEKIGFTVGSRTKVEQVIMNLLSNSKYAVDEYADYFNDTEYQKQIIIRTGFTQKNKVFLSIEDNGMGIEKENLEKVFDPFYTTKPEWKGTGLGLSIVYGILKEMRSEITVESEPGRYTRFTIIFPMYPEN